MVTPPPLTRGFNCGHCGAAITLRALTHARTVVCPSCAAVVEATDPNVFVLQEAARRQRVTPKIPLGSRGTWHGQPHEVVGFQQRSIEVDGERYAWDEYVLFNPYRGFRYLSDYQGHWNDIRTVRELVQVDDAHARPEVSYRGHRYRHFQRAVARTDFVLGEFPWRVTVGEAVTTDDYVAPPLMLSREATGAEVTWSLGDYTPAAAVYAAFGVRGAVSAPAGVFANQPNPYAGRGRAAWRTFAVLATLLAGLFVYRQATAARQTVLQHRYTLQPGTSTTVDPAFVTETFRLQEPGNVEVTVQTDLTNSWLGLDLALIDTASGEAYNVAQQVEYYEGSDGDGRWTEGDRDGRLVLRPLPAGEYYLRVDPETAAAGRPIAYTLRLRRDVPGLWPYAAALVLLLIPPMAASLREAAYETKRLAESDYTAASAGADEGDED